MRNLTKTNKTFLSLFVILIILIIICFHIGYKIPQLDKHKDWTYLDEYKDENLIIKKGASASVIIEIPNLNRFIIYSCCDNSNVIVTNENGKVLREFKNNGRDFLIDVAHNRLIEKKMNYADGKFLNYSCLAYDLEKFTTLPIQIIQKPVNERYEDYLKRLNIDLNYVSGKDKELEQKIFFYNKEYKASQQQYVSFLKSLTPVFGVYGDHTLTSYFHTDKFGVLYEIYCDADDLNSLKILDENWRGFARISTNYISHDYFTSNFKNFTITDSSTVVKNYFDCSLGINLTGSPYGSNSGPSISIEQEYLSYFSLKIKNKKFYFKIFDYWYSEKINQLNTPKSDNDTLFFMYKKNLYQAYLRKK